MPSPFPTLNLEERQQPWAQELKVGEAFGEELDFYRAITAYKRALILLPAQRLERRRQAEYGIVLSYYLSGKYCEATSFFYKSSLTKAGPEFPAYEELLLLLEDSFRRTGECEQADMLLQAIDKVRNGERVRLGDAIANANFEEMDNYLAQHPEDTAFADFLCDYRSVALNPTYAANLNGLLPGAGYWYVGQKRAAVTSFLINALFIWAAYSFFERGYIAAGIITVSFECGWYFGGMQGAREAAIAYNKYCYEGRARNFMAQERLFPLLMFTVGF